MKRYLYATLSAIFIAALIGLYITASKAMKYKQEAERYSTNMTAYELERDSLSKENRMFKLTIDDLEMSRDSINKKLLAVIKEQGIKNKNVQAVQYHESVIHKTDTVVINDTIFRTNMPPVDTTLTDQWYSLDLKLRYPSTIITTPTFKSEKYVIVHSKKEYVNKPSKIFFIRWFQKKRTVLSIDVVEKNPYIESKQNRFIEIVK